MSEIVYIYASVHRPSALYRIGQTGLTDLEPESGRDQAAVLILDPRDVYRTIVPLPITDHNKAREAAAFAIEDMIAQDIDACHTALMPVGDQRYLAETVDEKAFAALLDQVKSSSFSLMAVHSLASLFDSAHTDFDTAGENTADRTIIALPGNAGEQAVALMADPETGLSFALDSDTADTSDTLENIVMTGFGRQQAMVSLLQGGYRPVTPFKDIWLLWKRTALLCTMAALAFCGVILGETASRNAQAKTLDARAAAMMQAAFPGARNVPHMRQKLAALSDQAGDPFLSHASILLESISSVGTIGLTALRFNRERMTLSATLELANFDDVRRLESAINARGGRMTEGASRQSGDFIISDIIVEKGP